MKKLIKWLLLLAFLFCIAMFVTYYLHLQHSRDTTSPVIYMETEQISLSVQDDPSVLLTGVTAQDDWDGDVSDQIVVESISAVDSSGNVTVTYAAFDRSGNVTKQQRTATYTDYVGPKFGLTDALVFRSGYNKNLFDYVTAADPVDGDLSERIKATMVDGTSDIREEGLHQVELRVTNSMGETARLTVPVDVYAPDQYDSNVILSDYLIYLEQGSRFRAEDYLDHLYAGYRSISAQTLKAEGANIQIQSDVNTNQPGTYSATYTITYGVYRGYTRLIVVVEE